MAHKYEITRVKLSEKEQQILSFIASQADATASTISKALGIRAHSVQYALRRFHELKVIRRRVFLDTYVIGIQRFGLYWQLSPAGLAQTEEIFHYLRGHEHVALVLLFHGTFDIEVNIAARTSLEVQKFVHDFSSKFPGVIAQQTFAPQLYHSVFAGKGFSKRKHPDKAHSYGGELGAQSIDETDHHILRKLCTDERSSPRALAQKLGMPISTFQYRIDKMKKMGLIKGYTYNADGQRLGKMHFLFLVTTNDQTNGTAKEMEDFGWNQPNITYYVHLLGHWQYELGLRVDNMDQMAEVRAELLAHFGERIQRIETLSSARSYYLCDYPFKNPPF